MFNGQSAWFSQSVTAKRKRLWKQHGGEEVDFDDAKFVFSEDSECEDTKRLYQSDAYLNEHLAIFHASYINQCVKEEDMSKVVLGKYFLPPTDIQKLTKMSWDWTKQTDTQSTSDENEFEEESTSQNTHRKKKMSSHQETNTTQTRTVSAMTGTQIRDNSTRIATQTRNESAKTGTQTRDDSTRIATHTRNESAKTGTQTRDDSTRIATQTREDTSRTVTQSKDITTKKTPASQIAMVTDITARKRPFSQTETMVRPSGDETTKKKPATEDVMATGDKDKILSGPSSREVKKTQNPTVTKSVHIDVLPRLTGVVEDWIPGHNGCQVYLKT